MGDGTQSPDEFARAQSASTGLPEKMCRANMKKNGFVLAEMRKILDSLTRGLSLDVLSAGHGDERGVPISFQVQSPVVGLVLPSNSPGVHTLWLPIIPLQIGLVLKPGPQEPWTPYRMAEAFFQAGIPREAISLYPGGADVGAAVLDAVDRTMIFGGQPTVDRYRGNPKVQAHGPGFSKILLGDDVVDRWEEYLDVMVDSVFLNSGRGCINCSGIWASRHTREIADAIAQRLATIVPLPPDHPDASLAAFTVPGVAEAISHVDRRRPAGAGRDRRDREVPRRRAAAGQAGARRLPAADGPALRLARGAGGEEGIHVPLRHRRRSARRRRCSRRSGRRWSAPRSPTTRRCGAGCSTPSTSIA